MAIQLRKRLTCHYCGKRSSSTLDEGRKFKCEHCLAVNYLDEEGEITDVPANELESHERYAHRRPLQPEGDDFHKDSSIFCETCLKNQHLYNTALSEFLPDPDASNYAACEAALSDYMKDLETRYPQCCTQCEPKVRAKLQQATYNARSDHVRRMLERSRARRIASKLGWRSLVVNAAGLGYFVSLSVQLLWHAFGIRMDVGKTTSDFRPIQCFTFQPVPQQCRRIPESFMGYSLVLGLVCSWWNPKWQHRLQNREGRLVGLNHFYLLQLWLLVIRFTAWVILPNIPLLLILEPSMHGVSMAMIIAFTSRALFGTIKVDNTQLIDWNQDSVPLTSPDQFVPPKGQQEALDLPPLEVEFKRAAHVAAPSSGLSPRHRIEGRTAWNPPTPPMRDEDSMDWTPSQPTFQPNPRQSRYQSQGPNPFHGTLPALPARAGPWSRTQPDDVTRQAIGLPPGFFDKSTRSALPTNQGVDPTLIAQPKFFPQDANLHTGLENIFEKVFSLQDDSIQPKLTNPLRSTQQNGKLNPTYNDGQNQSTTVPWSSTNYLAGVSLFLLVAILPLRILMDNLFEPVQFSYYILTTGALITTSHLILLGITNSSPFQKVQSILFFGFETILLCTLTFYRFYSSEINSPFWDRIGSVTLTLLLQQEYHLIYATKPSTSNSTTTTSTSSNIPPATNNYSTSNPTQIDQSPQKPSWNINDMKKEKSFSSTSNDPSRTSTKTNHSSSTTRRYSNNSTDSNDSLETTTTTTSTISAWKTPIHNPRTLSSSSSTTTSNFMNIPGRRSSNRITTQRNPFDMRNLALK